MSRIGERFNQIRDKGGKALITYLMAGDPNLEATRELVKAMEDGGADMVELGIPFSDPLADGPTIQRASQRALAEGASAARVISLVEEVRKETDIPIILMTYYNPVFIYGEERFVKDAVAAGADGLIVPDLPPEEAENLLQQSEEKGLDVIFLLAPTSTPERINIISERSRGFIYYVSLTGVTGERKDLAQDIGGRLKKIREVTDKPVAVGFGVSRPEHAGAIGRWADGVVVGSAVVKIVEENGRSDVLCCKVGDFVRSLRGGLDGWREA